MDVCYESIALTLYLGEERRARLTTDVEASQVTLIGLELATQTVQMTLHTAVLALQRGPLTLKITQRSAIARETTLLTMTA